MSTYPVEFSRLEKENKKLKNAGLRIVEIKKWCKKYRVTYDRYKTALDERIEEFERVLE